MSQHTEATITVDGLMAAAFKRPREPRSPAYCVGVHTFLTRCIDGAPAALPFKPGTAECDAVFASEDEGRLILARAWEAEQIA